MQQFNASKGGSFYVIGVSYQKSDAQTRGLFSLGETETINLANSAKIAGQKELLAISTCNRTELYGFVSHPIELVKLLCNSSKGSIEVFEKAGYILKDEQAIRHIHRVGTGLDSQILGDFEIISQIKRSFAVFKKHQLSNYFIERLVNSVIKASKRIKNETELSSGAASVSFAAVQYILKNVSDIANKKILLFGAGKIGRNTCVNLVKHTDNSHITLINRTKNKAEQLAGKLKLTVKDHTDLQSEISKADVLIVATGATTPTVSKTLLQIDKPLLIIDLSVPKNVAADVQENKLVSLIHMDYLSQLINQTFQRRNTEVPVAEKIIDQTIIEFYQWIETRKFAPIIQALKQKLALIKDAEIDFHSKKIDRFNNQQAQLISDRIIQKITNKFANHLRKEDQSACDESLTLIKKVFELEVES